jgi:hypothetical protein
MEMETYTDTEKEYHTNIITDAIELYERRSEELKFPIEDHINLVLEFDRYSHLLHNVTDIVSVERYEMLFDKAERLARQLAITYETQRQFNFNEYYNFCKAVDEILDLILNESSQNEEDLEQLFSKMRM